MGKEPGTERQIAPELLCMKNLLGHMGGRQSTVVMCMFLSSIQPFYSVSIYQASGLTCIWSVGTLSNLIKCCWKIIANDLK